MNEATAVSKTAEPKKKKKKKKMSRGKKALLIGISIFVAMVLAAGGLIAAFAMQLGNSFEQSEKLEPIEVFPAEETRPKPVQTEAQNILLLGSDTRAEVGGDLETIRGQRSDAIMLMHIPADREDVQVISFMRDYWVDIPGHGTNKINAALSLGGVPLLMQTLEGMVGVRIDHVAIIDFEGFKGLTSALGGVTVDNPEAFSSRGFSFAQGEINLDGDEALEFTRARYPFTDGDYTRVKNQQLFLKGVIKKVMSRDTLTNPARIAEMVDTFSPYLTVDTGFDIGYLTQLGLSMRDLRTDNMRFFTAPSRGTGMEGDQSVVYPDWYNLEILAEHLQNDTVEQYQPTAE